MTKFSANLGFLWTELALADAIRAAKKAGFDAVECHWPYETPASDVKAALQEAGFTMLGINTVRGNEGENGLAALPGREVEARAAIDQALSYAAEISALNVHVMAGFAEGNDAEATFITNLRYATAKAAEKSITILIEPLNNRDAPGYFLSTSVHAQAIIEAVGAENLKLMFDCYHIQIMEGDLSRRLEKLLPIIGHIQFAGVPNRGVPNEGEVDYSHMFHHLREIGYDAPLGAEYRPAGSTEDSLDWLKELS